MSNGAPQVYANHKRFVFSYHVLSLVLVVLCLGWSVARLIQHPTVDTAMMVLLVLLVGLGWGHGRTFALKVQSRLIRLEERLRLAGLLPEDLRGRIGELREDQLIGLRFASDGEVTDLVRKVLAGSFTTTDEIKRAVKTWRPDTYRV